MVVPGSPTLWCVDPHGGWWDLAADYGAIVDSRRAHVERWLRAIEALDEQMPQAIAACEVVRAASQRPPVREAKEPQAENSEDQPQRFSRAWIERLASR